MSELEKRVTYDICTHDTVYQDRKLKDMVFIHVAVEKIFVRRSFMRPALFGKLRVKGNAIRVKNAMSVNN
jgi:hypothetical protein